MPTVYKHDARLDQRIGAILALFVVPLFVIFYLVSMLYEASHPSDHRASVGGRLFVLTAAMLIGLGIMTLSAKLLFEKIVVEEDWVAFIDKFGKERVRLKQGSIRVKAHKDSFERVFYVASSTDGEFYFTSHFKNSAELAKLLDPDFELAKGNP